MSEHPLKLVDNAPYRAIPHDSDDARIVHIRSRSMAENTHLTYDHCWRKWRAWCTSRDLAPASVHPREVAMYLLKLVDEGLVPSSIQVHRAAIRRRSAQMGAADPTDSDLVREVMAGIERSHGRPPRRVRALTAAQVGQMATACGTSFYGLRSASILALGFAAALRRSELVAVRVRDVEWHHDGNFSLSIPRAKADQRARGASVPVLDGGAIRAGSRLREWLAAAGIEDGQALVYQTCLRGSPTGKGLHPSEIARLVKRMSQKIGLWPAEYSAHSLRAGFVTEAARHHAPIASIMRVTRHKRVDTLMGYVRPGTLFDDHAGGSFL